MNHKSVYLGIWWHCSNLHQTKPLNLLGGSRIALTRERLCSLLFYSRILEEEEWGKGMSDICLMPQYTGELSLLMMMTKSLHIGLLQIFPAINPANHSIRSCTQRKANLLYIFLSSSAISIYRATKKSTSGLSDIHGNLGGSSTRKMLVVLI